MFLSQTREWVAEQGRARAFKNTLEAIRYCVEQQIRDVRIVMSYGDPRFDLHFYPFKARETMEETANLRERSEELKVIQSDLVDQVKIALADIAAQGATLPLKRKKKRQKPPEAGA